MEGLPKNEQVDVVVESEQMESVERAKDLLGRLRVYDGVEVRGPECREVENIAEALQVELQNIDPATRLANGLPWHPLDEVVAANDDQYAVAA